MSVMDKRCLTEEQIQNINKLLDEIEKNDEDPRFHFLETLSSKDNDIALENLLREVSLFT